jgi:hypothetical protein
MPSQAQMQDTVNRQAAAIRRMQTCDIRAIGEYDDEGRAEKLELTFFFIILAPWIAVMAVPMLLTVAVVFGFNALNNMHQCDYVNDAEVKNGSRLGRLRHSRTSIKKILIAASRKPYRLLFTKRKTRASMPNGADDPMKIRKQDIDNRVLQYAADQDCERPMVFTNI